jgi:hypothetical protein
MYFLGRGHLNAKAFLEQIKRLLAANNVDRAKKLCEATSAPVARVAKAGLNRLHRGEAAVAQAMEETMTDALPEVKTRIGALWSMANIVTLTGLLGTITGLINTFSALKNTNPSEKDEKLSAGIAEAMYNTAYGLVDRAPVHDRAPAAVGGDEEGGRRPRGLLAPVREPAGRGWRAAAAGRTAGAAPGLDGDASGARVGPRGADRPAGPIQAARRGRGARRRSRTKSSSRARSTSSRTSTSSPT